LRIDGHLELIRRMAHSVDGVSVHGDGVHTGLRWGRRGGMGYADHRLRQGGPKGVFILRDLTDGEVQHAIGCRY